LGITQYKGWKREGYGRNNINVRDIIDMGAFSWFLEVADEPLRRVLVGTKTLGNKPGYLAQVKKYLAT